MLGFSTYDTVQHTRTQRFYVISGFPKMRVMGEWVPAVSYAPVDDPTEVYVRGLLDFNEGFTKVAYDG